MKSLNFVKNTVPILLPTNFALAWMLTNMRNLIRYDIKSVRKTAEPFCRIESVSCLLWFDIGKRASATRRESESLLCQQCVRLK